MIAFVIFFVYDVINFAFQKLIMLSEPQEATSLEEDFETASSVGVTVNSPLLESELFHKSQGMNGGEKCNNDAKDFHKNMNHPKHGLRDNRAMTCLILWYFFSFTTLFLNKYILSYAKGDPTILGSAQLMLCCLGGYVQLIYPCGLYSNVKWERIPAKFFRNMLLVGTLRFSTLVLGLVALWYVPVSFAETVKSIAPVFTVFLAWFLVGEKTSRLVILSLFPVMGGLALCSANELSFSTAGFIAAMATNLSECLQNVYSKKLLSGVKHSYSPPELQFYTSMASVCVQIPALILMVDWVAFRITFNLSLLFLLVLNGLSFHSQSITEYMLLGYISPVTHSVANTAKRALLIWLSVFTFGNPVTFLSGVGTMVVIFGVLGYNKAREIAPPVITATKDVKGVHKI